MQLRPYQQELIENIKNSLKQGKHSVCAVLSCGGGKSVIAGNIAKSATDKGNRVLFIVHRKELCEQIRGTFEACGVDMALCTVGMVQTITRRLDSTEPPSVIICDEAHHSLSTTYRNIFDRFNDALLIGFTATPQRLNEGGLGDVFNELVESVSARWLIENHYLSPYKYYSVPIADVTGVKVVRGEYSASQLADIMENKFIYGETVKNYEKIAPGRKAIVYCVSVESAQETAKEFVSQGIRAANLDGNTNKADRAAVMQAFRNNEIQVLCNCELFGEGLDVPDVECVILLRKTKSLTLYIQQAMRSMRHKPGKTAIIIDHVGNIFEHGYPDMEREWTLDTKRRKAKNEMPVKQCEACYNVVPTVTKVCPECGYEFPRDEAEEKKKTTIDVELEEITNLDVLRKKPYDYYQEITSWDKLEQFRRARGYKFGWSIHRALELNIPIPNKYDNYIRRAAN